MKKNEILQFAKTFIVFKKLLSAGCLVTTSGIMFFNYMVMPAKADNFYSTGGNADECKIALTESVSYGSLPGQSTSAGGITYDPNAVVGEGPNFPETHKFAPDLGTMLYPNARRYTNAATSVSVPPNSRVEVGFFHHNYSGHSINLYYADLFLSRLDTNSGDWGRLGAGGNYNTSSWLTYSGTQSRNGRMVMVPLNYTATADGNPSVSNSTGRTIYSFNTIQPIVVLGRAVTSEFTGNGNMRLKYDLTIRNQSSYFLPNINVSNSLPSGQVYNQNFNFNPNETRVITYYADMGTSYPNTITSPQAVITDPNSHKEVTAIGNTNGYERSLVVRRGDQGAPLGWNATQPDFFVNGEFLAINLIPYKTYSAENTTNIPPQLEITKIVNDIDEQGVHVNTISPNENFSYKITIKNNGGDATNVRVTDDYDQNNINIVNTNPSATNDGSKIYWNLGNLVNNEERVLTINTKTKSDFNQGTYQALNHVEAVADNHPIISDNTTTNIVAKTNLAITKTISDSDETNVKVNNVQADNPDDNSRRITYNITVSNTGNASAHNVLITDNFDANNLTIIDANGGSLSIGVINWQIEALSAGESRTFKIIAQVKKDLQDKLQIVNSINVISDETPQPQSDTATTIVHAPILQITKTSDKESYQPGDIINWNISVKNIGTGNAYDIKVIDNLPNAGIKEVRNISDGGAYSGSNNQIIWASSSPEYVLNGSYAPNAISSWGMEKNLTFQTVLNPVFSIGSTNLINNVEVNSNYPAVNTSKTITINAQPNNEIKKYVLNETALQRNRSHSGRSLNDDKGQDANQVNNDQGDVWAIAGDTIKYTLVYRNTGNANTPDTYVTDHIPAYITDIAGNKYQIILQEDVLDLPTGVTVTPTQSGFDVTWKVGTLEVSESDKTITFRVRIRPDSVVTLSVKDGERLINNISEIGSLTNTTVTPKTDNAIIRINQPIAEIIKGADKLEYQTNEKIVYSITVMNNGSAIATGIVKDTLPEGLIYESTNWNSSKTRSNGRNLEFNVTLNPGESTKVFITCGFEKSVADLSTFNNTVTYHYTDENENNRPEINASHQVVAHAPNLKLKKRVEQNTAVATPGTTLKYTISYENTGSGILDSATITDFIPVNTTYIENSALPVDKVTFDKENKKLIWSLGNLKSKESGEVSFTVTINTPMPDSTELRNVATGTASNFIDTPSNQIGTIVKSGTISGIIWHDRNGNGQRDVGEEIIRDTNVTITTGDYKEQVRTNENGNFEFIGLPLDKEINVNYSYQLPFTQVSTTTTYKITLSSDEKCQMEQSRVREVMSVKSCAKFTEANLGLQYESKALAKTGTEVSYYLATSSVISGILSGGYLILRLKKRFS